MFGRTKQDPQDKLSAILAQVAVPGESADLQLAVGVDHVFVTDRGIRVVDCVMGNVRKATLVPWAQVQAAAVHGVSLKTVQVVTAQSAFKVPSMPNDALRLLGAIQARMV